MPQPSRDSKRRTALAADYARGERRLGTARETLRVREVDRYDLSAYEQGAKRVSANLLIRIAQMLEVRPDYFFQGYTVDKPAPASNRSL